MKVKVETRNLRKVRREMKRLGKQGENAFRGAMYAEGLNIIGKATEKAPAVTGRLRNSHFVSHPDQQGTVELGFGVIYAAAVEFGLRLINATRRQQKAAFASMRESGWKKSKVGGPGFFRGAITETNAGRVARIARTAKRFFQAKVKFIPAPDMPKSASVARAKGNKG